MAYNFGSSSSAATVVTATSIPSATSNHLIAQITPTPSKIETWEISVNIQDDGNDRNKSWQIVQVTTHWVNGSLKIIGTATNLANGTSGPAIWAFTYTANIINNLLEVKATTPGLSGLATARISYLLLNTQDGTLTHPSITPATYFGANLLSWIDIDNPSTLTLAGATVTSIADPRGGAYKSWIPYTKPYGGSPVAGVNYYSSGFNGGAMPYIGNTVSEMTTISGSTTWFLDAASAITYGYTNKYLMAFVVTAQTGHNGNGDGVRLLYDQGGTVLTVYSAGQGGGGIFPWAGSTYTPGPALYTIQWYPGGYNIGRMYTSSNPSAPIYTSTSSSTATYNLGSGALLEIFDTGNPFSRNQLCEFALIADHTDPVADERALADMLRTKWGI